MDAGVSQSVVKSYEGVKCGANESLCDSRGIGRTSMSPSS